MRQTRAGSTAHHETPSEEQPRSGERPWPWGVSHGSNTIEMQQSRTGQRASAPQFRNCRIRADERDARQAEEQSALDDAGAALERGFEIGGAGDAALEVTIVDAVAV